MSTLKIKLELSSHFIRERKRYVKNSSRRFKDYKRAVSIFVSKPGYPSLNLEKLQNNKGILTIRLNKSDRIFFIWKSKDTALFVDIGKHDKYRKY